MLLDLTQAQSLLFPSRLVKSITDASWMILGVTSLQTPAASNWSHSAALSSAGVLTVTGGMVAAAPPVVPAPKPTGMVLKVTPTVFKTLWRSGTDVLTTP
jgi:hypothetical protein